MSALDDIAAQRERIAQRLARVDAERAKLTQELAELEAAERVLSRFAQPRSGAGRRGRARRTQEETKPAAARGRRGRPSGSGRRSKAKPEIPLGQATLRAVEALGNEASAEQVREYLVNELGLSVRPNHLGMALQRHRRGGRLSEHGGHWSIPPAGSGESTSGAP